ncbi:nitrate reductase molybdenum cofactor assembly chaperone [Paremcibacter congregatus]|jgi:nitrate reductase delta subunit|uniref:nitrate reductase molybdenum cofactor assembly chaperone n=1 Tax=Paremcibacter congregatus TaxID=2043170 RepID=UPI003A8D57BD|tara:strand:+ start:1292 stop:2008 length:717 start_codon:yes stop_codon:yes gene_type:complete
MKTFKILGLLLAYPKPEIIDHLDEMIAVLAQENLLPKRALKKVTAFARSLQGRDIYEIQEDYVELFDRGRAHCLHLFEHIHGESRDRGQAMVNLVEAYGEKGFYITPGELPDYLPLFLEFLSHCPAEEATELLGDPINVIGAIGIKLKKRKAPYAVIFEALESLSRVKPDAAMMAEAKAAPVEELTAEDIDKDWEEAAAFDNTDVAGDDCNSCSAFPNAAEALKEFTDPAPQHLNGGQ